MGRACAWAERPIFCVHQPYEQGGHLWGFQPREGPCQRDVSRVRSQHFVCGWLQSQDLRMEDLMVTSLLANLQPYCLWCAASRSGMHGEHHTMAEAVAVL